MAWRAELLPGLSPSSSGFRVPAWLVGEKERVRGAPGGTVEERERFEDMRRRLEGEAEASGLEGGGEGSSGSQRRRNGNGNGSGDGGIAERLRGAW